MQEATIAPLACNGLQARLACARWPTVWLAGLMDMAYAT